MIENEQKLALLNAEKAENIITIDELEKSIVNLNNQINTTLTTIEQYEQQKTTNSNKITELESANSVIDDMITDYS